MIDSTIETYIRNILVTAYSQAMSDDAVVTLITGTLNDGEFTSKDVITTESISFNIKLSQDYASGPIDRVKFYRKFKHTEVVIDGILTAQRPISFNRNNPVSPEPHETTFIVEYKNKILEN